MKRKPMPPRPAGAEPAVRIPMSMIDAPTREGLEALSDAGLAVWQKLRGVFFHAEHGHPQFDPRRLLRGDITERRRGAWHRRRREWLAKMFKDDPRVVDVDA